jgi:hypothetical protein
MSFPIKLFFTIILTALITLAVTWYILTPALRSHHNAENTSIVLEKIKSVTKLITTEGYFSQLYHHKSYYDYDILNLFQKKIILRVNAKVSVGYNFEHLDFTIDSLSRTVTLNQWPQPEILSIDHDIDYFDIQEGVFTSFKPDEYTEISRNAKKMIEDKALAAPLFKHAEQQKKNYTDMLDMALKSAGWTFVVKEELGLKN